MKKSAFVLISLVLLSFALVSCDADKLAKIGKTMRGFSGIEIQYSDKEIKQQTETVTAQANSLGDIIKSKLELDGANGAAAKDALKELIDSIIDNPAGKLDAETEIDKAALNEFVKANNPLGRTEHNVQTTFNENRQELVDSIGEEAAQTIENIINELTSATNMFDSNGKATSQDVAQAASVALMGNTINELINMFDGESEKSDEEMITDALNLVAEFDDAARTYMNLTGTNGLAILDSINVDDLMGEEV